MRGEHEAATLAAMKTRPTKVAADADNRSRLLHAAADVFAEFGFEGASLRAIADAAGVSFQLIAYYFGSKEELWVATVDYLFERYLETGKGLGFTPSGNLNEQFHNHLRLLLTDMLQRPQLRKICDPGVPGRQPALPQHHSRRRSSTCSRALALPYFRDVVRLGIVERVHALKRSACCARLVCNQSSSTDFVELTLGLPAGSPKAVEEQVDLIFAILTERASAAACAIGAPPRVDRAPKPAARSRAAPSRRYRWQSQPAEMARASNNSRPRTCT